LTVFVARREELLWVTLAGFHGAIGNPRQSFKASPDMSDLAR
jgi:hypothetical protein